MNQRLKVVIFTALAIVLVASAAILVMYIQSSHNSANSESNPQLLLIPRWFLTGLTLDGQVVDILPGQQKITIQFTADGKVNGNGGCNSFSGDYQAQKDGKLKFGLIASTLMACAGEKDMQVESAYFQALGKVQQFTAAGGNLTLSSKDGKTSLVFRMPPK